MDPAAALLAAGLSCSGGSAQLILYFTFLNKKEEKNIFVYEEQK
jgi:hypothetical protein